ncbi:MAG: helix-turn-helix domain-containing protein [Desulfobaccales bacterium]
MPNIGPAWLNLKTASEYCGLGDAVLRRLVNDPQGLPHIRIGGRIIINKGEIDRFLTDRVQTGQYIAGVSAGVQRQVEAFITKCCVTGPGCTGTAGELYSAFTEHTAVKGVEPNDLMPRRSFGLCLKARGFKSGKSGHGRRIWRGLALRVSSIVSITATAGASKQQVADGTNPPHKF